MHLKDLEVYNERGSLYYVLFYVYIFDGIIGMTFTFALLYSSLKIFRKSKNPHLKICFGILVSDFLYSLTLIIMAIASNINGEYLPTHNWFCGLIDILYGAGSYLSIWYVALMSLERGLLIIHKIHFPIWVWLSLMGLELIGILVFNLISIFLNQMGLAELAIYCMSTPDYQIGYITIIWYFVMMCFSLLVMIYSYLGIAIMQRIRAWKDIKELHMDKEDTLSQANKVIRKVLILLALFLACNLTEIINTALELATGMTRSAVADFASILMLNFNPIINCIILIQFHDPIKRSLIETYPFLTKIFGKYEASNIQLQSVLRNSLSL